MADRGKIIGLGILLFAFVIGAANSILITNPSILDTDSSTYIIVVMLMLPILIIFTAKEDLKLSYKPLNIACGTALFVAFIIFMVFSRLSMSFAYASYRIDAFILPIFIMALAALLFGLDGIRKMKLVVVYAFFASPLLLLWLFGLNGLWANANAGFVYAVLKAFGIPLVKIGNTFSGLAGSAITISTACVSLGTFVALIMFMIPVAYLYEGSLKNKTLWLIGGFLLMVLLNILRITFVLLLGTYYGLSSSLMAFHLLAGIVLFCIAIIIMVLIGNRFNLHIKKIKPARRRNNRGLGAKEVVPLAIALAFGFITFALTSTYSSALYAPAISFNANASITQTLAVARVVTSLEGAHQNILELYASNSVLLFGLRNSTSNITTYVIVTLYREPEGGVITTSNYSSISSMRAALLKNGVSLKAALIRSGNSTFMTDYFSLPYSVNGAYVTENYEFFIPSNESTRVQMCNARPGEDAINAIYTSLYNTLSAHNASQQYLCASYEIANGA
ncbi:MAG: exosortase/archaeosortase family protein [Candidatus Micrarchaeaceae archaeon]